MEFRSCMRVAAAILALASLLGAVVSRADPLVIEGRVVVVDNSTLEIWGQRIRLAGITAPDPRSKDGQAGKRYLQELLAGIRVRCKVEEPGSPFGLSGRCVAAKVDIADRLVQMGFARSVRR